MRIPYSHSSLSSLLYIQKIECNTCSGPGQYVSTNCSASADSTCGGMRWAIGLMTAMNWTSLISYLYSPIFYVCDYTVCTAVPNAATVSCTKLGDSVATSCNTGTFLQSGACSVCPSVDNAATVQCSSTLDSKALTCNNGYYVSGGECQSMWIRSDESLYGQFAW